MSQSSEELRAHRRQFVLGPRPIKVNVHWRSDAFGSHVISWDDALPVSSVTDKNGMDWLLLGRAVQVNPARPNPLTTIAHSATDDIPALTHSWTGRWALLNRCHAYTDASGLLGCLYGHDDDGALWVSSSAALLASHMGAAAAAIVDDRELLHERGMCWFPPPHTKFVGVKRLLPSQTLDLGSGTVQARLWLPDICPDTPYETSRAALCEALQTALTGLADEGAGDLWLGLTAGYDSRFILALAEQAQIDVRLYTRITPRMSVADRLLPPALARTAGYAHRTKVDRREAIDRRDVFTAHCAGTVALGDAKPFLGGVRAHMDGVGIGGHGFALASGFGNWLDLPDQMPTPSDAADVFLSMLREPLASPARAGLQAWFQWVAKTPHDQLDWRDRLFLEQRQTGWLAAKEQVYDMEALERFPLLNSAKISACLLSIEKEKRRGSLLQKDVIAHLSPSLAAAPYNPPDTTFAVRAPHRFVQRKWYFASRRLNRRIARAAGRKMSGTPN